MKVFEFNQNNIKRVQFSLTAPRTLLIFKIKLI